MKACAVAVILLFASCIPTLLAQTEDSGSAKRNAEILNRWVQTERGLAAKGNVDAEEMLGSFYYFGIGVPQDYVRAATWYRKAAEQGDPGAQGMLGEFYLKGEGFPQDYQQAYFWLDLAAAQRSSIRRSMQFPNDAPQALKGLSQSMAPKVLTALVNERDEAASHLTRAELSHVQQSAERWLQSHNR